MKSKTNTQVIVIRPTEIAPDPAALQAAANRYLAYTLAVPLAVAATIAGLAGIGPQFGRDAR